MSRSCRHGGLVKGLKTMGNAKGTDIAFLRKRLRDIGPAAEKPFLDQLSPEERKTYETATPVRWVPIETSAKIQQIAVQFIFPGNPAGLQELGREQANSDLSGLYKIIVRLMTVPALIKKLSSLWHSYNDKGELKAIWQEGSHSAQLIVENYPELPLVSLQQMQGYFQGALEMTGAKNIHLGTDFNDSQAFKFFFSWE
jgi:hypothetical protein